MIKIYCDRCKKEIKNNYYVKIKLDGADRDGPIIANLILCNKCATTIFTGIEEL